MAEFTNVIKKYKKMCNYYYYYFPCISCPVYAIRRKYKLSCSEVIEKHPEEFEQAVMSWKKPTEHMKEQKEGEQNNG